MVALPIDALSRAKSSMSGRAISYSVLTSTTSVENSAGDVLTTVMEEVYVYQDRGANAMQDTLVLTAQYSLLDTTCTTQWARRNSELRPFTYKAKCSQLFLTLQPVVCLVF